MSILSILSFLLMCLLEERIKEDVQRALRAQNRARARRAAQEAAQHDTFADHRPMHTAPFDVQSLPLRQQVPFPGHGFPNGPDSMVPRHPPLFFAYQPPNSAHSHGSNMYPQGRHRATSFSPNFNMEIGKSECTVAIVRLGSRNITGREVQRQYSMPYVEQSGWMPPPPRRTRCMSERPSILKKNKKVECLCAHARHLDAPTPEGQSRKTKVTFKKPVVEAAVTRIQEFFGRRS